MIQLQKSSAVTGTAVITFTLGGGDGFLYCFCKHASLRCVRSDVAKLSNKTLKPIIGHLRLKQMNHKITDKSTKVKILIFIVPPMILKRGPKYQLAHPKQVFLVLILFYHFLFFCSCVVKMKKVGQSPAAHEYIQHYGNQAELKVGE